MSVIVRYAALAVLLTTLGFLSLSFLHGYSSTNDFQARRLEVVARSVAFVSAQEKVREDDAAPGSTQRFVIDAKNKVEGIEEILVLKRNKFLAHTTEDREGQRLSRDSLTDKALYDDSRRLLADVKKNVEERERNPDFGRNAFEEVRYEWAQDSLTLMVPVKSEGRAKSVVRLTGKLVPVDRPFPLGIIVMGIVGFVVLIGVAFIMRGPALLWVGTGLMALTVFGQATMYVDWTAKSDLALYQRMAQTYGAVSAAGLLTAQTEGVAATDALHETSRGVLDRTLVSIAAAPAVAPTGPAVYDFEGFRVTLNPETVEARQLSSVALAWTIAFALLSCGLFLLGGIGRIDRDLNILWGHREAYAYMASAMAGMLILVFIPVVYGILLGFQKRTYNTFEFVGLGNYTAILSDFNITEPTNFYFTLGVTVLWTASNVILHVSIGLFLALLLNDQFLKARAWFRVILILPWAVPNYITALIWKGMFHKQFGAINLFLDAIGIEGGVAWFQSFWPAFTANVATNTWLGFPFMMVVSLGALQSIPNDLYEAAIVDGASRWQRFRKITLPLLMPALVPAVIVGTVWTFNMFNIIYLVSGGAPNGATDILITDAFRWFHERERPGYAAAYATIIFIILAVFTTITNRITGATKGAFE